MLGYFRLGWVWLTPRLDTHWIGGFADVKESSSREESNHDSSTFSPQTSQQNDYNIPILVAPFELLFFAILSSVIRCTCQDWRNYVYFKSVFITPGFLVTVFVFLQFHSLAELCATSHSRQNFTLQSIETHCASWWSGDRCSTWPLSRAIWGVDTIL